jgi:uncharacterized protein (TIGR03084 family)
VARQNDRVQRICADLESEHDSLDQLVELVGAERFDEPTPAEGWSIRDQISHLWFFDQRAVLAMTDASAFAEDAARLMADGGTDASVIPGRQITSHELVDAWRQDRRRLLDVARTIDSATRVPWYGPAMGARSFITARLMETWAHGQDVADAIGVRREPTDRLRHVAHIGVGARPFSYAIRIMTMPDAPILVELQTPSGEMAAWGPADASDRVSGPLLDFCLLVTQRRHLADTSLVVDGAAATEWISIAQAFAGAPGAGRRRGQFQTD